MTLSKQTAGRLVELIGKLYRINGKLWDTEAKAARDADHDNPPLEKIGRLALEVRELNKERNGIKAEIVEEFCEGFKEIKVNYKNEEKKVESALGLEGTMLLFDKTHPLMMQDKLNVFLYRKDRFTDDG